MSAKDFLRKVAQTKPARVVRSLLEDKLQIRLSLHEPRKPKISVVVVIHNIPREAPRTLLSLSAGYQRNIDANDYEVIVVDNGSNPAVAPEMVASFGSNFRLIRIDPAPPSPAHAVNRGIAEARGDVVGVMIDGARIASPGLLHFALQGAQLYDKAVVATLGWYLGFDFQRFAMCAGHDAAREDALLASIDWPRDGYRLFDISTMDESSVEGWFFPVAESNALFMRRELWVDLGGVEEKFDVPGGGLLNLDTYTRAMALPDVKLVVPIGEATFHQLHGGTATNRPAEEMPAKFKEWDDQYEAVRGHRFRWTNMSAPTYIGVLPRSVLTHFVRAAVVPLRRHNEHTVGPEFDIKSWSLPRTDGPKDPTIAALVELARQQLQSGGYPAATDIARLAARRAPNELEPQRLLSMIAIGLDQGYPQEGEYFVAMGDAYRLLREREAAESHYRKALTFNTDIPEAHVGLSHLRLDGETYYSWLERFYAELSPASVIEIGVEHGQSIALARPPTLAIGIDPNPRLAFPLVAETHVFPETSDVFFARGRADALLAGRPLGVGFIDGLHLYEQALKDFINLERYCGPKSVILVHDTLPLDEATQSRARNTKFHTGDVWKVVPCLKHYRPDLDVFTIATPWTGLTIVTGLDPTSRVLEENYEEAIARFVDLPYADIQRRLDGVLDIVPNNWDIVRERLRAHGIFLGNDLS